ncbi:MAG: translation factor [Dehalococcoidia bacterium]|nr:translation factor [Dehalococcoidia bacterium]
MADSEIRRAVDVLLARGTVAFPTDTVYGLGAHGLDPEAVRKVFRAKHRSVDMPVPLLVADLDMLRSLVLDIPDLGIDTPYRLPWQPPSWPRLLARAPTFPDSRAQPPAMKSALSWGGPWTGWWKGNAGASKSPQ